MKQEKMSAYDRYTFKTKQRVKRGLLAVGITMVLGATVVGGIKLGKKLNLKNALKQEKDKSEITRVDNVVENRIEAAYNEITKNELKNEQSNNLQNNDIEMTIRVIENDKDVTNDYQGAKDTFEKIMRERAQKRESQNQVKSAEKSSTPKIPNAPTLNEEISMEM